MIDSPLRPSARQAAIALIAGFAAATGTLGAQARDPHTAMPERPTVSIHAGTVARGWLEFESGIQADRGPGPARATIVTTAAKIGLTDRTQFTFLTSAVDPRGGGGGIGDFAAGVKWRLADGHAVLGDFALQPVLKAPTGSAARGTGTGTTDVSLYAYSSRDIGSLHLDVNLGYTARSGGSAAAPGDAFLWSGAFSGSLSGDLGWAAELFGYPGMNGARTAVGVLAGPSLAIRNWIVVDGGVIVPVTGGLPRSVYLGATYNVGRVY